MPSRAQEPSANDFRRSQLRSIGAQLPVRLHAVYKDPEGDNKSNYNAVIDLVTLRGGTNGAVTTLELEFSSKTNMKYAGGYIYLDVDQNPATGRSPSSQYGLSTQDKAVGFEYYIYVQNMNYSVQPTWQLYDSNGKQVEALQSSISGQTIKGEIPSSSVDDDGNMTVAATFGDGYNWTDWAPEESGLDLGNVSIAIYPESGTFLESQNFDLTVTFRNPAKGTVFFAGLAVGGVLTRFLSTEMFALGDTSLFIRDFGKSLKTGTTEAVVVVFTSDGVFFTETAYDVKAPLR